MATKFIFIFLYFIKRRNAVAEANQINNIIRIITDKSDVHARAYHTESKLKKDTEIYCSEIKKSSQMKWRYEGSEVQVLVTTPPRDFSIIRFSRSLKSVKKVTNAPVQKKDWVQHWELSFLLLDEIQGQEKWIKLWWQPFFFFKQGKLQLWVDIFPISDGKPPAAVDVKPRQPIE